MLALTRKSGESIVINNDVEITVLDIKGDQVKIGITAPKSVPVYRKEVYIQIQEANKVECRLFTLQGGLFLDRLKGMNRLMMKIFSKSVIRGYKAQKNLTADEEALLDLFRNGGSRVSEDNLTSFYEWYDMQ